MLRVLARHRAVGGLAPQPGIRTRRRSDAVSPIAWILAGAMIATAGYHAGRMVAARVRCRRCEADVDVTHAVMGVAMSLMLVGSLTPGASLRWAMAFAIPAVWFVCRGVHAYVMDGGGQAFGQHVRQGVGCAAMLYMVLATAATGPSAAHGMAGMHTSGAATGPAQGWATATAGLIPSRQLDVLLAVATAGVAIWTWRLIWSAGRARLATTRPPNTELAPAVTAGCQLAMNVTTIYMLALML
jgi:hypothetical protein